MKIFIGYEPREDIAYKVCVHSILARQPKAEVIPLVQQELRDLGLYTRDIDKLASTEFTFTRFLVPELCDYNGWALFIDCDTLIATDIQELFDLADDRYAVMCVKHNYKVSEDYKMDGQKQTSYPRKNWSSVMLFNCSHPSNRALSNRIINDPDTTGAYLHRMSWLEDSEIGELNHTWNYLADVYTSIPNPKIIHYTSGGPWFTEYKNCPFNHSWNMELAHYLSPFP